ncbi:MAG: M28 family peptidase, partial [Caulobacterales bacterium]|nr:M28 family peptidase [Caulobacterales bacterium]
RARDVSVIGFGASELEDLLAEAVARQNRELKPDARPEAGLFYRSDHVNLAKIGVPVLYLDEGFDHIEKGLEHGEGVRDYYFAHIYHKPADEYFSHWDLGGMVEDTELVHRVGLRVADSELWPNWYEGNEFRALRDAQRAAE